MRKILFLLPVIALSACSSTPSEKECPPEKNYIKSNPEAMEKYKEEFKNSKIKSLYYDMYSESLNKVRTPCKHSSCISFDIKKYDFVEFYFNNELRKGVYTSHWSANKEDPKCKETPAYKYSAPVGCYYLTKNNNDEIKSKYSVYMRDDGEATIKKFYDIKNNKILYESSSTIYTTESFGAPSYGICGIKKENISDINYRFNPVSFPYEPLEIFY